MAKRKTRRKAPTRRRKSRRGKKKSFFAGKKKRGGLVILGIGALALWLFSRGAAAGAGEPILAEPDRFSTAATQPGTSISVKTYRVLDQRRNGMNYDAQAQGSIGSQLFFVPTVVGKFTRNFLQEGGQLYAEIA